jgi:hypothetical protein
MLLPDRHSRQKTTTKPRCNQADQVTENKSELSDRPGKPIRTFHEKLAVA